MDQKLLNALNNIGDSLYELVEALKSKEEAKTDTSTALKSGDFGDQLKAISIDIKSIKEDTKKIIKNQETIIALAKGESEKKEETESKKDNSNIENIKKGVGTIILIAAAVLAIGGAFKLVGDVNVVAVIAIAAAITIISLAFEKIAKLDIDLTKTAKAAAALTIISIAIVASSILLSLVAPVSTSQLITSILIGGVFVAISNGLEKMMLSFKNIGIVTLIKSLVFLPLILPVIALSIALSSQVLGFVKPISFSNFTSAVMIAAIFSIVSYGLKNIIQSFNGLSEDAILAAGIFIPIILPALATSIAISSWVLQLVTPISFAQAVTALLISGVFLIASFGLSKIIKSIKDIKKDEIIAASWAIPLLFASMSLAIAVASWALQLVSPINFAQFLTAVAISVMFVILAYAISPIVSFIGKSKWEDLVKLPALFTLLSVAITISSWILSKSADISFDKLAKIGLLGGILSVISLIMILPIKILGKLDPTELAKGAAAMLIIAATIMASSLILSFGEYSDNKYPSIDWSLGVGMSLLTFGLASLGLGLLVSGPLALVMLAGLGAIAALSLTIVGVSKVLKEGDYKYGDELSQWAKGTVLLYAAFTPILLILGTAALASSVASVFGLNPWEKAKGAILEIADTIVNVSNRLQSGNYKGGPNEAWAKGISIALGAFSPIYSMLMRNGVLKLFGGSNLGPKEFSDAILTVTDGIVTAADRFHASKTAFIGGPTETWSKGVGLAIGAFAPVYSALASGDNFWIKTKGFTPEEMKSGIITISDGIVEAAKFFGDPKVSALFRNANSYPSPDWSRGVGLAISSFSPVYEMLSRKSWYQSSDSVIKGMTNAITKTTQAIVDAAKILSNSSTLWAYYPSEDWSRVVGKTISSFIDIFKDIEKTEIGLGVLKGIGAAKTLVKISKILFEGKDYFKLNIDPDYIKNMGKNMLDFNEIIKKLSDSQNNSILDMAKSIMGVDPISQIAKGMMTLAKGYDALANSLTKLGSAMKVLNISDIRELSALSNIKSPNGLNVNSGQNNQITAPVNQMIDINSNIDNKAKDKSESSEDKMDEIIRLLTNISGSSISIDQLLKNMADSIDDNIGMDKAKDFFSFN